MALEQSQLQSQAQRARRMSTAEIIDRLTHFDGPPEQFLMHLLTVQCHLATASAGAVLRAAQDNSVEVLAIHPPMPEKATAPVWLAQSVAAAGEVLSQSAAAVRPLREEDELYGSPAKRHVILVPLMGGGSVRGVGAFLIDSGDPQVLALSRERLELTAGLLSLYEMRLTLQRRQVDMRRMRLAMETLAAVNEHDRFAGSAMILCNEVAARWNSDRVGLGFLKGRYVELKALSHTEKFNRKMKLVQDIEAAMEECLDQDVEILHPSPNEATAVSRATGELSRRHGPTAVLSLPLRRAGKPVAVLTVERPVDKPFTLEETEALRLTCDLCVARLAALHETDRWFGARLAASARKGLGVLVGPKHTWLKIAAALIIGLGLFMVLGRGDQNVDSSFTFESTRQQVIAAPFDGKIKDILIEPGSMVEAGRTVLAHLDTIELEKQLVKTRAERFRALKEASESRTGPQASEAKAQMAELAAQKALAEIERIEQKIRDASLTSPISGVVVSPDRKRIIGQSVSTGEAIFEVAALENLRAELLVPEDEIADVVLAFEKAQREGATLRGELAAAGKPDVKIGFVVERINPAAELVDQKNVVRVRVRLDDQRDWMLPGLEGVAKIHVGKATYGWLWTRPLVNWVRLKLWL